MNGLIIFYGICGVVIVSLLIRIWFKNRAAKLNSQPAPPSTILRPAVAVAPTRPQPVPSAVDDRD